MRFARKKYRNRPTKWQFLNRFYNIQRETWPQLKEALEELSVETNPLEEMPEWQWIVRKISKANTKPDPVAHLNQINIYRLEQCVLAIEERVKELQSCLEDLKVGV